MPLPDFQFPDDEEEFIRNLMRPQLPDLPIYQIPPPQQRPFKMPTGPGLGPLTADDLPLTRTSVPKRVPYIPPLLARDEIPTPAHYVPSMLASAATAAPAGPKEPEEEKDEEIADLLDLGPEAAVGRDEMPPQEGPEPFEKAAAMEGEAQDRENEIGKLMFMRSLGENLDLLGRGLTGAAGHLRQEELRPMNLHGMDYLIGRAEDRMTPTERQMVNDAFGTNLPSGESLSRIQPLLPALSTVARNRQAMLSEAQRRQETRALSEEKQAGINERFGRSQQLRNREYLTGLVQKANQDSQVKMADNIVSQAELALDMLNSGDQQAAKNAVVALARLVGEKGPLTNEDREDIRRPLGITGRIETWIHENISGEMNPQVVESMKKMAQIAIDLSPRIKQRRYAQLAKQWAGAAGDTGITEEQISSMLEVPGTRTTAATVGTGGGVWIQNPATGTKRQVSREQAEILKAKGGIEVPNGD